MRIILTGGGTVSHVLPILLVAESLKSNKRNKIIFIGSKRGIERDFARNYNVAYKGIFVGKKRAYFSFLNYFDYLKIILGIVQVYFTIIFFKPDIIFAKGGYVTFPTLFWARVMKLPLVIHESDVIMGQANKWASKFARKVCLGFPLEYYKTFDGLNAVNSIDLNKAVYTGIPVQKEFLGTKVTSGNRKKILVTGGTQGSSKINNIIFEILNDLLSKYDVFHITGKLDYEKFSNATFTNKEHYYCYPFTDEMPKIMRDSDLVITRAGASTLMELSASRKAAILIPLKTSKNEHQIANAKVYEKNNAAVVLTEEKLTSGSLLSIVNNLMADDNLRNLLGHHANSFYQASSIEDIIEVLFGVTK